MSLHRFGDWTAAPTNARLHRATEPSMTPRLLSFAAVALCVAWVPAPPDPLAADPDVEAVERGPAIGEAELAPYFTSSALKSALSELQAGRAANALRFLPRRPADAPTRWLKALALKAADHPKAARALFEQLAMEGGPLADRALHMAALCAIDQGSAGAAERLLAQVSLRYVDADQVLLERARQTMDRRVAGPRTAARVEEILQPILGGQVRADIAAAHLIAGDAQLAAGAKEKARSHWRAAWIEHPLSPAADTARDRERQLGPGGHIAQILLVRRAEMLLDAHRNREALDQLARIMVPSLCLGGCPGDRSAGGFLKAALGALGAYPEQHQPTPEDVDLTPEEPGDPLACRVKLDEGRRFARSANIRARARRSPRSCSAARSRTCDRGRCTCWRSSRPSAARRRRVRCGRPSPASIRSRRSPTTPSTTRPSRPAAMARSTRSARCPG